MEAPRSRQRREGGTGREEILRAAKRLFMTRGFRAVSTREMAVAAGVTQPALYHHFGGKEDLYVAVLEEELSELSQAIRHAARLDAPGTARLAPMATRIARRAEYDLSLMFHDLRFEVSAATRHRIGIAFRDAMMTPMLVILHALAEEGSIAPLSELGLTESDAAMFILGMIRSLTDRGAANGEEPGRAPATVGAMTVRLVVHGLG